MDSHSMASKVNRAVCQLKVNGCLPNTSACFDFTVRERRRRGSDRGTSHCCAVLFSCLLFRGQQRLGFDKAAFISIYKAGV